MDNSCMSPHTGPRHINTKEKKKYRQQIVKYKVYTIRLVAVTLDSGESKAMGQGRVQTGEEGDVPLSQKSLS